MKPRSLGSLLYSKERRQAEAKAQRRINNAYKMRAKADKEYHAALLELDAARKVK